MRLGRNEDPTFTIKTMVVQTQWPGATLDDTLLQVTERIERKLQETPHLDYLKSYTKAGQSTVFVYLKGSTGPKAVSDTWYQVRKKVNDIELTLPQGVIGPVADDEFGDTYGIVYGFTADGFTHRELRDYVEDIRVAAAAGARRLQGEPDRRPARTHLHRVLAREAGRLRPQRLRRLRRRCRHRTPSPPPASSPPTRRASSCGSAAP